ALMVVLLPLMLTVSLTGAWVVLSSSEKVPVNPTFGTPIETVALPTPANPSDVMMNAPDALVMFSKLSVTEPRARSTLDPATVTTLWLALVVLLSNRKSPVRAMPKMVNCACSPGFAPEALTLRYGPAGKAGILTLVPFTLTVLGPIGEFVLFS